MGASGDEEEASDMEGSGDEEEAEDAHPPSQEFPASQNPCSFLPEEASVGAFLSFSSPILFFPSLTFIILRLMLYRGTRALFSLAISLAIAHSPLQQLGYAIRARKRRKRTRLKSSSPRERPPQLRVRMQAMSRPTCTRCVCVCACARCHVQLAEGVCASVLMRVYAYRVDSF